MSTSTDEDPKNYTVQNLLLQYNFQCNVELPLSGYVRILSNNNQVNDASFENVGTWQILPNVQHPVLEVTDDVPGIGQFQVFMPLVTIPEKPGTYYVRSITPGSIQIINGQTYEYTVQFWQANFLISSTNNNVYIPYIAVVNAINTVSCDC